ncbi:MAG: hypothetical protein Kow0077_29710 [Anaerolineae bacterium]
MHLAIPVTRSSRRFAILAVFLLLVLVVFGTGSAPAPFPSTLPVLGGGSEAYLPRFDGFSLRIPTIDLEVDVYEALVRGDTWDFSVFTHQAAHLQLTAFPGQGSNVVIGAHYELANFEPGPFIDLDEVPLGAEIFVDFAGHTYVYEVTDTMLVHPENIEVAYRTRSEVLTLLTCYEYAPQEGVYARRYVVRAELVEVR